MLGFALTLHVYLSIAFSVTAIDARVREFELNVAYAIATPDGFTQEMMLANGQLDYPINANKGDTVRITVNNFLDEPTSIHWHGLFQTHTPWFDGAGMVTQCPIQPGASLVYEFNVGNQTGTFWWHAHLKSQYINGLRGPFIIHDPQDPYLHEYDDTLIITLTDHYHNSSQFLLDSVFYNINNTNANEPFPESGLIGGRGSYDCSVTQSWNPFCFPDWDIVLESSTRLHKRDLISRSMDTTVIEADGVYMVPTVTNVISIHSAQRYSVILAANKTVSNYWIRAQMYDTWGFPSSNGLNMDVRAVLSYNGATDEQPTSSPQNKTLLLNQYLLPELNGKNASQLPLFWDYNQTLYVSFNYGPPVFNYPTATFTVMSDYQHFTNQQYFIPEYGVDAPPLNTLLKNNSAIMPASINPFYVHNNQWVYIMIQNTDAMEHPFHLHGHTFYVLSYGNLRHQNNVPPAASLPRRDVIQVPACTGGNGSSGEQGCLHGFVNIAVLFDNPGVWLFHCHIEWHMSAGLVMTFINNGDDGTGLPEISDNDYSNVFGTCLISS